MYNAAQTRYDTMQYPRCGDSGLRLPAVSLGFWHNFGSTGCYDNMRDMCFTAFDNGITHSLHCPFIINQNRYSIFDRTIEKNGLKDTSAALKKGIIAFSPLAQGLLTDRYLQGIPEDSRVRTDGRFLKETFITEEMLSKIRSLNALALERGQTLAEMALAWVLKDGLVTSVLIGASRPQQILDNIKAIQNTTFSKEELLKIDDICS